jgi:hypothetical protein
MKINGTFSTAATVILAALFCVMISCKSGAQARQSGPFFTTVFGETVPAFSDSSSADAELDISLTLIDAKETALKNLIRPELYGGQSPQEYAEKLIDDWKTTYTLTLEENSEWGFDQSWTYNEEHDAKLDEPYAVISRNIYQYQGGAHGLAGTDYLTIDTRTPRLVSLDEIIPKDNSPRLDVLIEKELRALSQKEYDTPIPPGLPLSAGIYFEDTIQPADFYPKRDGLHFQWDTYEIAAYAFGAIDIVIGWKDLADILSPAGADMAAAYSR